MTDAPEWLSVATPTATLAHAEYADETVAEGFDPAAVWLGQPNPEEPAEYGDHVPAPLLRRVFTVDGDITDARLSVAALGYYEARLNGERVGDALLDPPMSQFDRTVYSRSYDVTSQVRSGENVVGLILGRGFASGITAPGAPWTTEPRALAQLEITLADGSTRIVVTDEDWRLSPSPIRDWMYYGETYDARLEQPGWDAVGFDDGSWLAVEAQPWPTRRTTPAVAPPIRVVDTFAPVSRTALSESVTGFDAGRITSGWARITVHGEAGTHLTITYGQQRDEQGRAVPFAPGMHVDEYVLRGDAEEIWEPRFTRHSFQYVDVEVVGGELGALDIDIRESFTDAPATGGFRTSNPLLQRIHDNHQRSLRMNHWGFPTDTAGRDRQGWTADTALFIDSAMLGFAGLVDLYRDWLGALRDTQQADGSVSIFAPDSFQFPIFNDPSWSGMIVLIPWTLFEHTGELDLLEDNYPAMLAWMSLMEQTIAATGDLYAGFSFGDHSPPGAEDGGTISLSPPEGSDITRNAHLYLEARTLARIARTLGDDGTRWDALADRIAAAFTTAYLDVAAGEYRNPGQETYRQTSNLIPLAFDLVPLEHRDAVLAGLVADLEGRGARLNTGAIGTKHLLPTLTRLGHGDLAYRIATQTAYPSWGYWVEQGATSSWETWSNQGPEQTLDHPFLGTVDDWFYRHLAGLRPALPGYEAVHVEPLFAAGLERAEADVATSRGTVVVAWRREATGAILAVDAPEGVPVTIVLPRSATARAAQGSPQQDAETGDWHGAGALVLHVEGV